MDLIFYTGRLKKQDGTSKANLKNACVCACVRACMRACVCVFTLLHAGYFECERLDVQD